MSSNEQNNPIAKRFLKCHSCGRTLPSNSFECSYCGSLVTEIVASVPASTDAPSPEAAEKIVARCTRCRGEFTAAQIKNRVTCPSCGTEGVPMSPEQDVTVAINWHELRILTIWAENHASSIKNNPDVKDNPVEVVFSIARAIQDQHPFMPPLTLSGEIESLKKDPRFKHITTHGIESGGPVPGGDNEIG